MQIRIQDGIVDLSGEPILKRVNIEINTESKIGIIGRNGSGKTTLLRLLSGELSISKDNPEIDSYHIISGKPVIGSMSQMAFTDNSITMLDEIRGAYKDIIAHGLPLSADFFRHGQICHSTPGGTVVGQNGQPMAGRLCQTDIPGDHSGKNLSGKMPPHFLSYLVGKIGTSVEHGQKDAKNV